MWVLSGGVGGGCCWYRTLWRSCVEKREPLSIDSALIGWASCSKEPEDVDWFPVGAFSLSPSQASQHQLLSRPFPSAKLLLQLATHYSNFNWRHHQSRQLSRIHKFHINNGKFPNVTYHFRSLINSNSVNQTSNYHLTNFHLSSS